MAAAALITGAASLVAVRTLPGRYLRVVVAGESMTPALRPDDFLVLRAGPPKADEAFGRIVAVRDPRPEGDGRLLLKRIVGVPGDSLRVGGGSVQVNGRALDEPYAGGETPYEQHRGINRLADGEFFVLGDNRAASTDSRDFGPVADGTIVGTAVLRYWPLGRAGRLRPPGRRFAETPEADGAYGAHEHHAPTAPSAPTAPGMQPLPWVERTPDA